MNFDEMSDLQVNRTIAFTIKGYEPDNAVMISQNLGGSDDCNYKNDAVSVNNDGELLFHDYCNSWSDIGPLIEEYEIELKKSGCEKFWYAQFGQYHSGFHSSPKRAAAICIIKLLEAQS